MNSIYNLAMGLVVLITLWFGLDKYSNLIRQNTILEVQNRAMDKKLDKYIRMLKEQPTKCKDKVDRAVQIQKDIQDVKDKVSSNNTGIITLPLGLRR